MVQLETIKEADRSREDERQQVAAAKKNPEEFVGLYDRYVRKVFRYLYSRIGEMEEAEDLTAQTFLEALEALPRYRDRGCFSAWLFSIASRKAADHFRRRPKLPLEDAQSVIDPVDVLEDVAQAEDIRKLRSLLRRLSAEEQEWIRLHFTAKLTFKEIGAVIGKSEEATKKAIYRLLAKLQSGME